MEISAGSPGRFAPFSTQHHREWKRSVDAVMDGSRAVTHEKGRKIGLWKDATSRSGRPAPALVPEVKLGAKTSRIAFGCREASR